ncbi:MAG: serine hydrolase domain-containing protein [Vicinamibacterales bacterium]
MKSRLSRIAAAVGLAVTLAWSGAAQPQFPQTLPYAIFERYVEALRQEGGIPGLSAAIIRNGQIGWIAGFGREDIGRAIPASPDTPYVIGGITQAISALLLGICVDRHLLEVDDPIRRWALTFPESAASVRNVLAHASEGAPTGRFRYDPALYSALTHVVDACSEKPYRQFLADEIIERFGLARSVPGIDITDASNVARQLFEPGRLSRFDDVVRRLAVPYRVDRFGSATASQYPSRSIDAATGMVASVYDLARLDAALDVGVPVSLKTLNDMWSAASFGAGSLPTGLGWFVQTSFNERLVWQFGLLPDAGSGIWLRVPGKRLTLILLANSPGLATGLNLEQGDVTVSPFVKIFLRLFL